MLSMYRSKQIFYRCAIISVLISLALLFSGCTINIYFMDSNPASVQDNQNDASKQAPEIQLTPAPEEAQLSVTPPTATQSASSDKKYVGSINSNIYHFPDCEWAQKINPSNQIWFTSPEEAKAKGYSPCKVCKPPSS